MKNTQSKIVLVSICLLIAIFSLVPLKTKATTTALSGSCGAVFGLSNPTQALWEYSNNSVDEEALNALAVINFDDHKISYEMNSFVVNAPGNSILSASTENNMSFTVTDHPSIANVKKITLTNGVAFNVLPINSTNTYLIQGVTFGATGVCSKI